MVADTATLPEQYRAHLHLPDDIRGIGEAAPDSGAVLVTGATGFLGSALVGEVVARQPERHVYCLVRSDDGRPDERLRRALGDFELWDDAMAEHVHAVAGDLTQPQAGLSPKDAELLRTEVSLIYHSGAFVNLAFPFDQVRAANVDGTVEMLRLAGSGRPKRMCHISTMSTIEIDARNGDALEDPAPLGTFAAMTTGYTKSKWIAEQLVEQASARGLDVRTLRLGALAGHSRTGVSNPNDYAWLVVCACLEIGAVPLMRAPSSWLPVDLAAQASIALTDLPSPRYRPYQLMPSAQITYAHIFSWLRRAGYHLPAMAFDQWRDRLRAQADRGARAVQAIASVIPKGGLPGDAQAHLHSPSTEAILASNGVPPPQLTETTFRILLATGQRRKEIPSPAQGMP